MAGAHLRDPRNEWVLMFRSGPGSSPSTLSYVYSPGAAASKHLVANLQPGATVYVSSESTGSGSRITVGPSQRPGAVQAHVSVSGTLYFQLSGQSVVALPVPVIPRGFRVVQ
jgi:hypothetical protein